MNDRGPDTGSEEPEEPEELGELEELEEQPSVERGQLDSPGYEAWKSHYLRNSIPSLYLDKSLRIIEANDSFYTLFNCDESITGLNFAQFYAKSFDAKKSSELFRAVLSADARFEWHGKVERIGSDQLPNISKVWIQPADGASGDAARGAGGGAAEPTPRAYAAIFLDMTAEHRQLLQGMFASLLGAARLKDNDTGRHIERVNLFSRRLAQEIAESPDGHGIDREFLETIGLVAALHDVGKIGTPDDILNKAGQLEAWEWNVMKQHTINGAYILSTYPSPMAREIALHHHERWDGTGYPMGLGGELIPLSARICGVADVYDALRMRRSWKNACTHEQAVENVAAERGTHFDPFIVEKFLAAAESFRGIFSDLADSP